MEDKISAPQNKVRTWMVSPVFRYTWDLIWGNTLLDIFNYSSILAQKNTSFAYVAKNNKFNIAIVCNDPDSKTP